MQGGPGEKLRRGQNALEVPLLESNFPHVLQGDMNRPRIQNRRPPLTEHPTCRSESMATTM
eukprot:12558927-Alexandrium_andersonii.AAC.1